jgi:hypothetical protein
VTVSYEDAIEPLGKTVETAKEDGKQDVLKLNWRNIDNKSLHVREMKIKKRKERNVEGMQKEKQCAKVGFVFHVLSHGVTKIEVKFHFLQCKDTQTAVRFVSKL